MKSITEEDLFVLTVESGSLKSAAEVIGTDPSSVSRKLANLESRLGVKLLQRSTKQTAATEVGLEYYKGVKQLLDEKRELEESISGTSALPSGTLRVAAPHDFAERFIAPVVQTMITTYPDLNIELLLGSHFEDLKAKQIDIAIRIGKLDDSSLICRQLGHVPRVLVASKSYIERMGQPQRFSDLSKLDFIFYNKPKLDNQLILGKGLHREAVAVSGKLIANSVAVLKNWVNAGLGVHYGPLWAFKEELAMGSCVQLLPELHDESYPIHALYLSKQYTPAKVREFVALLTSTYQQYRFD
ncbi:LysR family transcriptional regulator [Pseudoalteromonas piscicida]|uniref:LysR family transcriptional regulator n=1 Tax=Pseudoalteromonas piscicida TaxID=43662 RepID=A0AAQ2IQX5_PSEO7|nr:MULTISPECIES: LysR family transcriptional regulator [Pseudoalteromonas]KJY91610.1 LysR family transcriptional regulator [Pseudoalteromonas piscicida]MDP4486874.1 LysR family transcriptional regulator [Pseudoalteromonas piscicida]TMN40199.1 LysR family transcriptional regulator [Pseudoalteromonas piscicida]TMN42464.1 LysR family transcriptional regulator [Pseudoalteromonas piscicida]TMN53617.1 LysR family transcriptional regulator [Pseudoalteromonas piscicida]